MCHALHPLSVHLVSIPCPRAICRSHLQLVVDNQLRDELNEAEHVHEARERRENERIPRLVGVVDERVDGVACEYRDRHERNVTES